MKIFILVLFTLVSCSQAEIRPTLRSESGRESIVKEEGAGTQNSKPQVDPIKPPSSPSSSPSPSPIPAPAQTPSSPTPSSPNTDTVVPLACTQSAVIAKTKKICETTLHGVKVKFVPLADGAKVSRLAFYLHGDTAGDWKNPFVVAPFVEWAASKNILLVLTLSTAKYDDDVPGDQSYGAAQPEDAEKLAKVVEEFVKTYKTPSDNLLYFGTSGGPWFMTSSYIPLVAGRFPGLFALSCGASTFWQKAKWNYKDPSIANKVKILFNYGDKDFLLSGEEKSFDYYKTQGIEVSKKVHAGATHCSHDVKEATIAFWEAHMK